MPTVLMDGINSMPLFWKAWIYWMMLLNSASIVFCWKKVEARFVLGAWIPNGIFMALLAEQVGYTRILGISHAIFWTPLVILLLRRRTKFDWATGYGLWLYTLILTNSLSLIIDYVDVIRFIAGDRDAVTFN